MVCCEKGCVASMENYLIIADKKVLIEESGGRCKFKLSFLEEQVPLYHKEIIGSNLCDFLLPISFLSDQDTLWITYDFTGCIQFSEALLRRKDQGLFIAKETSLAIASVARSILLAENCLLDSECFPVLANTLFFELRTKSIKLAYIPGMCGITTVRGRILNLIKTTGELSLDDEWIAYGEEIARTTLSDNLGLTQMAFLLEEKAGEMTVKQWPDRSISKNAPLETEFACNEEVVKKGRYRFFSGWKK